jgi:hypothetical protein
MSDQVAKNSITSDEPYGLVLKIAPPVLDRLMGIITGLLAMATSAAMFIHFVLLNRGIPMDLSGVGIGWPAAAAALYLTYMITANFDLDLMVSLVQTPLLLGALLWLVGFFRISSIQTPASMTKGSLLLEKRPA